MFWKPWTSFPFLASILAFWPTLTKSSAFLRALKNSWRQRLMVVWKTSWKTGVRLRRSRDLRSFWLVKSRSPNWSVIRQSSISSIRMKFCSKKRPREFSKSKLSQSPWEMSAVFRSSAFRLKILVITTSKLSSISCRRLQQWVSRLYFVKAHLVVKFKRSRAQWSSAYSLT